mmetsp:Transcript_134870/g.247866  ORF Transcript_134870/g.247866 Transcript_134870/m.247866 type:complete len:350 (-) Transcript_134870:48-1097(-)
MADPGIAPAQAPDQSQSQNGLAPNGAASNDQPAQNHSTGSLPSVLRSQSSLAALQAHKGHRNLFIRGCCAACQMLISIWLAQNSEPTYVVAVFQGIGSLTLFMQWRKGNPLMFLARGCCSWALCFVSIYAASCGSRKWPGDCGQKAWRDDRVILRILHIIAAVRVFANGLSLFCQFMFPHRMFLGHGNEQLFYRGCIQATGVIIHIARFVRKTAQSDQFKQPREDLIGHWLRTLFIAISSWSLFHQWWHTGAGHTGHPLSDAWENLRKEDKKVSHSLKTMHDHAVEYARKYRERANKAAHKAASGLHHQHQKSPSHQASTEENHEVLGKESETVVEVDKDDRVKQITSI